MAGERPITGKVISFDTKYAEVQYDSNPYHSRRCLIRDLRKDGLHVHGHLLEPEYMI